MSKKKQARPATQQVNAKIQEAKQRAAARDAKRKKNWVESPVPTFEAAPAETQVGTHTPGEPIAVQMTEPAATALFEKLEAPTTPPGQHTPAYLRERFLLDHPETDDETPTTAPAAVETTLVETPAEVPQDAPTTLQGEATPLRWWLVRRGLEVIAKVQAGSEEWALKASKKYGDGLVVEPEREIPATRQEAAHAKKKDDATTGKKTAAKKDATTAGEKKLSLVDAAAKLLAEDGGAMGTKEIVEKVVKKGWWTPGAGKTPDATLYSAIIREIKDKGKDARFKKTEPGKFAAKS